MPALPTASPASVGVDPDAVAAFVAALGEAGLEVHGFILARHDRVCAQGWWAPYGPDAPHLIYSLSKTFAATAWALAEADGLVERDRPLIEYWPEHAHRAGPRAARWTARELLRMASGHTQDTLFNGGPGDGAMAGFGGVDAVAWCFAQEPDAEPGSVFAYNQLCTYLLGATLQKLAGEPLTSFLRPRLFEPLGIDRAAWQADNHHRQLGFTGLHVRLDAALRLGLLYLRRGEWGGRRLLDPAWVDEATSPLSVTQGIEANPDWACGYGYQIWMARHGYRGDGACGQFMIVLPEADAVLVINSGLGDMQAVLDLAWTLLLPGLAGPSAAEASGAPLTFTDLALAPVGGPGPDGSFVVANDVYDNGGQPMPVPLREVTVRSDADGWRLSVVEDAETRFEVTAGDGSWVADTVAGFEGPVALASSAGWRDGLFHARIQLVTTPHAVLLTGDPHTGRLDARWSVAPLRGRAITHLGLPAAAEL